MVEDYGRRFQTLEEGYSLALTLTSKLEQSIGAAGGDIGLLRIGLKTGVTSLVNAVTRFGSDVVKLNRESLRFNRTFNESVARAGEDIKGLPGGIRQSLESLFKFQAEGLMNASKETLSLANKMGITGQNVGSLVKLQKTLITQGLLSTRERATFSESLNSFSTTYGVSTELLVNSVNKLGDSISIFGLTGSMATVDAVKELSARFPAFGDEISKFVNMLMKADFGTLANLGIDDDVAKLFSGGGAGAADILSIIDQTKKGMGRFGDIGSGRLSFPELEHIMAQGGDVGGLGAALSTALENAPITLAQEEGNKLMSDLTTALKMIFDPIAQIAGTFIIPFLTHLGTFIGWLEKLHLVSGFLLVKMASLISAVIANTAMMIRKSLHGMGGGSFSLATRGMVAGTASTGAMVAGAASMLWPILAAAGVMLLIGLLAESTQKLATAEELRAKAELRKVEDEHQGFSRFEAVTRSLINDFIQTQNMADSIAFQTIEAAKLRNEELAAVIEASGDKVVEAVGEDKVTFA